ncbi:hypothetical protein, unlikely [Trypanosoma brucei gambiense DAL972]|uniref:Uncharacterized protein n=1 Tax=Trypanosoma brucei gambiense (strain MHOM/CI/86/DAL972) TaxID=679716 RepID=D0A5L4_TRYB9|nr:hypothetical protein, unlikely [Trypanosoma brucei gambiense DAL972]CBH16965.1 hypothetical protein, unlikely [Trypanosoma brucei gambiense DAL972]|eukprot:XP_011779229.1 hypothetical protein, unlikely [Trypanosoma brucei gambiense DAL972]
MPYFYCFASRYDGDSPLGVDFEVAGLHLQCTDGVGCVKMRLLPLCQHAAALCLFFLLFPPVWFPYTAFSVVFFLLPSSIFFLTFVLFLVCRATFPPPRMLQCLKPMCRQKAHFCGANNQNK